MRKTTFLLPVILTLTCVFLVSPVEAQFCLTPEGREVPVAYAKSGSPYVHSADEIVVRVHLHKVGGSPWQDVWTDAEIDTAFETLQDYYASHRVRFQIVGRSSVSGTYENEMGFMVDRFHGGTAYEFQDHLAADRLDIFFLSKTMEPVGCDDEYMMNGMSFPAVWGGLWVRGVDSIDSFILSHEVGHSLGLKHTHEGGQFSGDCWYNGDLICDTPPSLDMRNLCGSITSDCEFVPTAEMLLEDPSLANYTNPPVTNIMSYSDPECMDEFTPDQIDRVMWIAETDPYVAAMIAAPAVLSRSASTGSDGVYPHVWTFTWETLHEGDPSQDRVVVNLAPGAQPGCLVSPNVLRPTTSNAEHTVVQLGNGVFRHKLVVPRSSCVPRCQLNYQVFSTYNGTEYAGSSGTITVKRCIGVFGTSGPGESSDLDITVSPNPFNPRTVVSLSLSRGERSSIVIYNLRGERIQTLFDGELAAGDYSFAWEGRDRGGRRMPSGVYYVRATVGSRIWTEKISMLK